MKKIIKILLSVLIIAFIIKAPTILDEIISKDWLEKNIESNKSPWKGKIVIYNCHQESQLDSKWLVSVLNKYEKLNKGVYIDYKNISKNSLLDIIDKGTSRADVLIFPESYKNIVPISFSFSCPKPEEKKEITEEFEFFVDQIESPTQKPIEYNTFGVHVFNKIEQTKKDNIHKLLLFISQESENMIK